MIGDERNAVPPIFENMPGLVNLAISNDGWRIQNTAPDTRAFKCLTCPAKSSTTWNGSSGALNDALPPHRSEPRNCGGMTT